MEVSHCANCGKLVGFKRKWGFGTVLMIIFTAGFWILALPFYPLRCSICGLWRNDNYKMQGGEFHIWYWIGGILIFIILMLSLGGQ